MVVLPDYLYCYRDHPVWGKFLSIKLWGNETYRNLEATVSEGGEVKAKGGNDTYFNEIFMQEDRTVDHILHPHVLNL